MLRVEVAWLRALVAVGAARPVRGRRGRGASWTAPRSTSPCSRRGRGDRQPGAAARRVVARVRGRRRRSPAPSTADSPARTSSTPRWCCSPATRCTGSPTTWRRRPLARRAGRRAPGQRDGRPHADPARRADHASGSRPLVARCRARRAWAASRPRAAALPVQCGGAAGTLSLVAELTDDPVAAAPAFADELGLVAPDAAVAHPSRAGHADRRRARDRVRRPRGRRRRRRRCCPAGDRRAREGAVAGSWRVVDDAAQAQPGAERPGAQRGPAGPAARRPAAPRRGPGGRRAPRRRLARRVAGAAASARAHRDGGVAGRRARRRPARSTPPRWPAGRGGRRRAAGRAGPGRPTRRATSAPPPRWSTRCCDGWPSEGPVRG